MAKPDKSLLSINLNKLEEECAYQPQNAFEWGMELAKARAKTKDAKKALGLTEAEIGRQVREDPEAFGVDRITEKAMEHISARRTDWQEAKEEVLNAEYEEDLLDIFFKCWMDRKEQLSNEVKLFNGMYFAKPDSRVQDAREAASKIKTPKAKTMRD